MFHETACPPFDTVPVQVNDPLFKYLNWYWIPPVVPPPEMLSVKSYRHQSPDTVFTEAQLVFAVALLELPPFDTAVMCTLACENVAAAMSLTVFS